MAGTFIEADEQRRARHLRALAAVNRQLQAQLEGRMVRAVGQAGTHDNDMLGRGAAGAIVVAQGRRVGAASAWLEELQLQGGDGAEIFLAKTPQGDAFLIEGTTRRSIKAGLLVPAIARVVGPVRDMSQADLDRYGEGPPVEVLEAPSGPAFLLVGGRRLPIRGLPLPYLVSDEEANVFPLGEEVNVSLGAIGGGKWRTSPMQRAKQIVSAQGPVQGATTVARKAVARVKARMAPKT